MQQVAERVAADTGQRVVLANPDGRVIVDSSRELIGQVLSAEELRERFGVSTGMDFVYSRPVPLVGAEAGPRSIMWARSDGPAPGPGAGDVAVRESITFIAAAPVQEPFAMELAPGSPPLLDAEQVFTRAVTMALVAAVIVGGLLALLVAALFSRRVLRPVDALTAAARRMGRGDLQQRVAVSTRDEIGQLGQAFNTMAEGLERTERLRRQMVTDIAHELRTPLTNLRGYLEALRDGVYAPSPETLASLHEEAVLLAQLVDDLQDLTLADAGQLSLHREPLRLADALVRAQQALLPQAEDKGVQLRVEPPASALPNALADDRRVGQILRNLISNAIRHTPPGGQVVLSAATSPDGVEVVVRDTGEGIAAEHLPHVFERFYRADSSRARATGGAGIGLAVVKQLVEAHHGRVTVQSTPGEGSTFRFALPAVAREAQTGAPAGGAGPG
jgi:signal transduction histidine kinase